MGTENEPLLTSRQWNKGLEDVSDGGVAPWLSTTGESRKGSEIQRNEFFRNDAKRTRNDRDEFLRGLSNGVILAYRIPSMQAKSFRDARLLGAVGEKSTATLPRLWRR